MHEESRVGRRNARGAMALYKRLCAHSNYAAERMGDNFARRQPWDVINFKKTCEQLDLCEPDARDFMNHHVLFAILNDDPHVLELGLSPQKVLDGEEGDHLKEVFGRLLGFVRIPCPTGDFAHYLAHLSLALPYSLSSFEFRFLKV